MKAEVGTFGIASTGTQILVLNDDTLVPKKATFWIGKPGSNVNYSYGDADGTRDRAVATLNNGSLENTEPTTDYCIYHKKDNSGSAAVAVAASVTSFDTGEIEFDFDAADISYPINYSVVGD